MKLNKTKAWPGKKVGEVHMGQGLAFQLFYMRAFRATFLEHGKCQVLHKSIFPPTLVCKIVNK